MKRKLFSSAIVLLPAFLLMTAFVVPLGGEGYEIYVNNKLVIRQFGAEMKQVKNLQLDPSKLNGDLSVKFFHCGMTGKRRILQLKTPAKEVLKQWQFANGDAGNFSIAVPLKEIVGLQKKAGGGTLHLYYSSKEAPDGRFLAGVTTTSQTKNDAR